jgi:hypothetical protein
MQFAFEELAFRFRHKHPVVQALGFLLDDRTYGDIFIESSHFGLRCQVFLQELLKLLGSCCR